MAKFIKIENNDYYWINVERVAYINLFKYIDEQYKVSIHFSAMENEITYDGIDFYFQTKEEAEKFVEEIIKDAKWNMKYGFTKEIKK